MTMCTTTFTIDGSPVRTQPAKSGVLPSDSNLDAIPGYALTDCSLTQELLKPIEFQFTLRRIALKKTDAQKSYSIVNSLLGKVVYCKVETKVGDTSVSEYEFRGKIVGASLKGINITCVAKSADAQLQGKPKCRCFINKKISDIVTTVASKIISKKVSLQTDFESLVFPYIVQYNESDYDFLVRLAKRFGAFFYVAMGKNGESQLVFGKLPNNAVVNLTDDSKSPYVAGASYELQTGNPNYWFLAHDDEKDLDLESEGMGFEDMQPDDSTTLKKVVNGSVKYVKQEPNYCIDYPHGLDNTPSQERINSYNKSKLYSESDHLVTCRFVSYLFNLQVGNIVKINRQDLLVVISTHLTWDRNGSPQNEITAFALPNNASNNTIDENKVFAPYMNLNAYPKSSAQRATVISNVDPLKMGRIQVKFNWQLVPADDNERKKLPWIRIAQPYGGGKADKGQGCYILPEIGEEVMVGFEHDNLEKPYVIGTLYHNSDTADNVQMPEASWVESGDVNKQNEVKAFRTKKGHTIEFHDVDGNNNYGFIRVYGNEKKDGPNYDIILSTDKMENSEAQDKHYSLKSADDQAGTTAEINAEKEYKAEKLRLMVKSNGGDIMLDAGDGDIYLNAKNIHYSISGNRTTTIKEKDITSVGGDRFVDVVGSDSLLVRNNQDLLVKGNTTIKHQGSVNITDDQAVNFEAQSLSSKTTQQTEIKASDVNVEATQAATIKANSGMDINGGTKVDLSGTTITLDAKTEAQLNGKSAVKINGNLTHIKGTSIELDASTIGKRSGKWADV